MKTIERHYGGDWRDKLLNAWPLCLDALSVDSLFSFAWDVQGRYYPEDYSLFYNGYFFVRLTWPFGIWLHLKPRPDLRFQCGIGWKLNGRFALLLRAQSDQSATAGTHGPNTGQARGWERGTA
jgi:hypothetical protein